jgi:hypothetical protein
VTVGGERRDNPSFDSDNLKIPSGAGMPLRVSANSSNYNAVNTKINLSLPFSRNTNISQTKF